MFFIVKTSQTNPCVCFVVYLCVNINSFNINGEHIEMHRNVFDLENVFREVKRNVISMNPRPFGISLFLGVFGEPSGGGTAHMSKVLHCLLFPTSPIL